MLRRILSHYDIYIHTYGELLDGTYRHNKGAGFQCVSEVINFVILRGKERGVK